MLTEDLREAVVGARCSDSAMLAIRKMVDRNKLAGVSQKRQVC